MTDLAAYPAEQMPMAPQTPDDYKAMGHRIEDWGTVQRWWNDIADELKVIRRESQLNESFDRGDQHVTWSTAATQTTIRELTGFDRYNRMSVNKMRARRRAITARLTSSPMSLEVRPAMPTDTAMRNQRLAEHVLLSMAAPYGDDWEMVRAQEVTSSLFGGIAAICWEWDPDVSSPPLAQPPPTDPMTGMALPCGGIKLTALSVHEFGLEAGSRSQRDACYWIRQFGAPPEQVQRTYRLAAKPSADAAALASPMAYLLDGSERRSKLTAITVMTRKPYDGEPGSVSHYVNGRCVSYTPWPYPHDWLNVYVFRCDDPKPHTYLVDPWWSDLRQPQQAYNEVRIAIRAHVKRAANARIIVPTGGVDLDVFSDEAGEVVEYDDKPEWMSPPEVARWLVGEVERIDNEINDLAGSPDIARGVAPGDRNSGAALALLAEKADGPLGPFAQDRARGWSLIATSVMRTLRHNMPPDQQRVSTTYPQANDGGSGVPIVRTWTREDIDANVTVNVPMESVMPKSQTALRASLIEMKNAFPQVFEQVDGRTLAKITGLSSLREMLSNLEPDEAFAEWENELMMAGEVVVPDEWHNHMAHLERHERQRNSAGYEMAAEQIKSVLDDHIEAHHVLRQQAAEQAAMQHAQEMAQAGIPPEHIAAQAQGQLLTPGGPSPAVEQANEAPSEPMPDQMSTEPQEMTQ